MGRIFSWFYRNVLADEETKKRLNKRKEESYNRLYEENKKSKNPLSDKEFKKMFKEFWNKVNKR